MIEDKEHKGHFIADDGKVIILKGDKIDKETNTYPSETTSIWLGKFDSIDNYEEIENLTIEEENADTQKHEYSVMSSVTQDDDMIPVTISKQ